MRHAVAVIAVVMVFGVGCSSTASQERSLVSHDGARESTTTSASTTTTPLPGRLVAEAHGPLVVYDALGPPRSSRTVPAGLSGDLVLLVRQVVDSSWLLVELPVRPNGSVGFVRRSEVELSRNTYTIDVRLSDRRLTVRKLDTVVFDTPVAVGKPATPTPTGSFYVTELLRSPNPAGDYGPYIYALSGFSPTIAEFNGKDAIIGIHGTDEPASIGRDVTHGCIRLPNDAVTRLVEEIGVPLGTPVTIS